MFEAQPSPTEEPNPFNSECLKHNPHVQEEPKPFNDRVVHMMSTCTVVLDMSTWSRQFGEEMANHKLPTDAFLVRRYWIQMIQIRAKAIIWKRLLLYWLFMRPHVFFWCKPEQTVKRTVELPVISYTMTLMYHQHTEDPSVRFILKIYSKVYFFPKDCKIFEWNINRCMFSLCACCVLVLVCG